MTLSIIIVNYNGKKYLSDCLNSIKKQCKGFDYEIIILDNASSDGSVEFLKKNYSDSINLIESKENMGFARGNNTAAMVANGRYLLLLNNDTILLTNPLKAIKKFHNPQIGVISMKMLGTNKEYRYSAGNFPTPLRLLKLSQLFKKNDGFKNGSFQTTDSISVNWVEGSFLLTKLELWKELKGLDEDYFMYAEDIDYCRRIQNLSYEVRYLPVDGYIHYGGYGSNRQNMLKKSLNTYVNKHLKGSSKIMAKLALQINFIIKNAKKIFKKSPTEKRQKLHP